MQEAARQLGLKLKEREEEGRGVKSPVAQFSGN